MISGKLTNQEQPNQLKSKYFIKDLRTGSYLCDNGMFIYAEKNLLKATKFDLISAQRFIKNKPHLKLVPC